jgi:hypothetical protein
MENPAPEFRIYRIQWWQRAIALVSLGLGVFFVIALWEGSIVQQSEALPMEMMVSSVWAIFGLGLTARSFKATITFTADAVELHSLFGHKSLPLNAIRGRREYAVQGSKSGSIHLVLVSNDDRLPALDFGKYYTFDDTFFKWFYELPDLDAKNEKRSKNSSFGLI